MPYEPYDVYPEPVTRSKGEIRLAWLVVIVVPILSALAVIIAVKVVL